MLRTAARAWTRALYVLALAALVPLVPFAVVGELPGERWLVASSGDALRFGATGALLLAADVLLPIPSSVIGALLGGRLGFAGGFAFGFLGTVRRPCDRLRARSARARSVRERAAAARPRSASCC